MHLHEVEQHLVSAFNSGIIGSREYLESAGALRDLDELLQRIPSTDKDQVLALHEFKPAVIDQ
jgi:hypothetical protein